jgi:hypothetical protein
LAIAPKFQAKLEIKVPVVCDPPFFTAEITAYDKIPLSVFKRPVTRDHRPTSVVNSFFNVQIMQCLIARGIKHMLWGFKSSDPNNMTLDCLQAGSKQIVADFSLTPKRI